MISESIVYVWGADNEGQLGLGKNRGSSQYYHIPKICHYKIGFIQVSCGKDHTALLTQNGYVYTMGCNEHNKLGHVTKQSLQAPQKIEQLSKVIQVSCGYTHTACITSDGSLFTWGDNSSGQLGVKQNSNLNKVNSLTNCIHVSCGNKHTLVLTDAQECFGFGLNDNSQLGIQRLKTIIEPTKIKLPLLQQTCAGNLFSVFLTQDGIVYICGLGFGNLQKLNYKQKFIKIDGKSTPIGLTSTNELIFFELDEQLMNIKDFCMGDLVGMCIGDKAYQWQFDPEQKRITQLKSIDQLNSKQLIHFSAGNSHLICIEQKGSSSFIESVCSSTTTLRGKHEERSKSNYTEKQDGTYNQKIQQLEKQLEEKDRLIQQMKVDYQSKIQQMQQKQKEMEIQLQNKDKEISKLTIELHRLQEFNQNKNSDSEILQCHVQDDESEDEDDVKVLQKQTSLPYQQPNLTYHHSSHSQLHNYTNQQQLKSPVKTLIQENKYDDNLQKNKLCKTDHDRETKYQSFEKQKKKEVLNERPQSSIREKTNNNNNNNNEKTNLTTIKSRLTDLQKNKEQLEQRMRQFEDRLRENKLYTK
ncbi:unnamed protein product [Paramecium primaurelia]|uniref:RCC1-like domain-containing protein n=1 Tax=Paramecium primaurelia TaxID=5886 RepID=A0A8S1MHV3_PARPR|nr:unnamed protein product [Paramecium primaurelia]